MSSRAVYVALALFTATPALAQEEAAGRDEYLQSCASCHGQEARGDGPLAELMTVEVPDLTGIVRRNDGIFPMLDVIQIIDGRTGVRGHGFPMPVWGDRYKAGAVDEMGSHTAEIVTRGRILSLALYLQSIQR